MSDSKTKLREVFLRESMRYRKGESFCKAMCPDAWFFVKEMRKSTEDLPYRSMAELEEVKVSKVILILESPHIDEFKREQGFAPANGKTGRFLRSFWGRIFNNAFDSYVIVLVNAVQYQCSLGNSPIDTKTRDQMFQALITQQCFISDLKCRISSIVSRHDIIFNACTKGKYKVNIKGQKFTNKEYIQMALKGMDVVDICHPSSWLFNWKHVRGIFRELFEE